MISSPQLTLEVEGVGHDAGLALLQLEGHAGRLLLHPGVVTLGVVQIWGEMMQTWGEMVQAWGEMVQTRVKSCKHGVKSCKHGVKWRKWNIGDEVTW